MYQQAINADAIEWTASDFPGVSMRLLTEDERSGALTVMTRLEPGAVIPRHLHSTADETVFVLSGDFIEEGVSYSNGSFFVGKAGTPHGPHKSHSGCVVLTTFSATLDFILVPE